MFPDRGAIMLVILDRPAGFYATCTAGTFSKLFEWRNDQCKFTALFRPIQWTLFYFDINNYFNHQLNLYVRPEPFVDWIKHDEFYNEPFVIRNLMRSTFVRVGLRRFVWNGQDELLKSFLKFWKHAAFALHRLFCKIRYPTDNSKLLMVSPNLICISSFVRLILFVQLLLKASIYPKNGFHEQLLQAMRSRNYF